MRVYTGRGDSGTTGLFHGGRVSKATAVVDAYGTIDEAVSALGLARAEASADLGASIIELQSEMFVVGAELATSAEKRVALVPGTTAVSEAMNVRIAGKIDRYEQALGELTDFVMPGETRVSAALDFARTVVRRAERLCVALVDSGELDNAELIRYLNRLSDLIFLMAREAAPDSAKLPGV